MVFIQGVNIPFTLFITLPSRYEIQLTRDSCMTMLSQLSLNGSVIMVQEKIDAIDDIDSFLNLIDMVFYFNIKYLYSTTRNYNLPKICSAVFLDISVVNN